MMSEWISTTLGNILDLGNGKVRPQSEGEIPVFGGNGILGYCDKSNYEKHTVIIGRVGAYCGSVYYADKPVWISDNALAAIPKGDGSTKFLYYFLKNLNLNNYAEGSSHPLVTQSLLKNIEIEVTNDIKLQESIAEVLSSIDDKINLLHRNNKTLEQLAETLFRQWFMEEADDSWEEKTLYDVIELIGGGTPMTSKQEYWDGSIGWLSGGDITINHKSFVINSEKKITESGLQNCSARLLPKYATVISARGTVGKYCLLGDEMAFSQSNYGIKPKIRDCFFFTYLLINHSVDELQTASYGTVFDTITTNTFKSLNIKLPKDHFIIDFNSRVEPLFNKILHNVQQTQQLIMIRDALLPKLMSGSLRVIN